MESYRLRIRRNGLTKNRLQVLKWWLKGNKNNVSLPELIRFFFAPSYSSKADSLINRIEEDGSFLVVYFKTIENPLYYPKEMSLKSLKQVIVETFYEDNWHYYQIEETKVEKNDIVVDCGAAEGLFALKTAPVCKKVYLIEPMPKFVEGLKWTFRGYSNIEIIPCALSDQHGEAFMSDGGIASSLSDDKKGRPVNVETIDALFYEKDIRVSYIKADLEGYDFRSIVGAKKTIQSYSPKIAVTTYHDMRHAKEIAEFIASIKPGYKFRTKGIYQETGTPVMLHAWC